MPIVLPTEKVQAVRKNPKTLVLYSAPKIGKTTAISQLENCLIIDLEDGSDFVDALKVKVSSAKELVELGKQIIAAKKPYKIVAIDTVSKLEEWCEGVATERYKKSVVGKNFAGSSVLDLANGAGYHWLRMAFLDYLNFLETLADHIIFVGHLKDKFLGDKDAKTGSAVGAVDIDLTGKLRNIVCQKADAIGYMRRKADGLYISFATSSTYEITCGARPAHLRGKEFKIAGIEANPENVKVDWSSIYLE